MIKEYVQLKWTYVENDAFDNINATMVATPDIQSIHFFKTSYCILLLQNILLCQCSFKRTRNGMSYACLHEKWTPGH
jgi:hypothetical protein